jgi:hypothetical protein
MSEPGTSRLGPSDDRPPEATAAFERGTSDMDIASKPCRTAIGCQVGRVVIGSKSLIPAEWTDSSRQPSEEVARAAAPGPDRDPRTPPTVWDVLTGSATGVPQL